MVGFTALSKKAGVRKRIIGLHSGQTKVYDNQPLINGRLSTVLGFELGIDYIIAAFSFDFSLGRRR